MSSIGAIDMYISPLKRGEKLSKKELREQMTKRAFNAYRQFETQKSERGKTYQGKSYKTKSVALIRVVPYERAKERKPLRDTRRRAEMPDEEDERLENYHYANFLGDKYTESVEYNTDCRINLAFCDTRVEFEGEIDDYESERIVDDDNNYLRSCKYYDYDALIHAWEGQYMNLMDAAIHRYNERKEYEEETRYMEAMAVFGCNY
jgi:hypothetical protein